MRHKDKIRKALSFILSLATALTFILQGIYYPPRSVFAAQDKLKLFGVDTDLTPKEFCDNLNRYAKAMNGYKYGLTGTRYDSSEETLDCISFVELVYKLAAGTAKGKNTGGTVAAGDSWRSDIKYYKEPGSTSPIDISSWTVSAKDIYGLSKPYTHNLRTFRANVLDDPASGVSHTSFTNVTDAKFYSNRIINGDPTTKKDESDSAWRSLLKNIKYSNGAVGVSDGDIMIFYVNDCDSYSDIALHVGIYHAVDGVPGVYHCSDSRGVTYVKDGDKVSYKVTKDSSTGHYGVRWEPLSDGISKDAALTHIAVYKTVEEQYPVNCSFLLNKTFKDNLFIGAEFTVYESDKTTVRGKITDDDGNGIYSNYKDVDGGSCLVLGIADPSNTTLSGTFYVKETKAPTDVVTPSGTFKAKETYIDDNLYKIEVSYKTSPSDPSSGTFTYKVSGGLLDSKVTRTISSYKATSSYKDNDNKIRLSNDAEDYVRFSEADWLKLAKKTNDESVYDTKMTKLTLRKADDTALAHYMYSDSGWGWYLNNGATYYGSYYPLMTDSDYKITETFTVPQFHCYDGKTIPYTVTCDEWQDKTYSFSTKGKTPGSTINITCTNNVDSSSFRLSKSVNYGTREGFVFTLLTEDKTKVLAKGISDSKGVVMWKYYGKDPSKFTESDKIILPCGRYRLEETIPTGIVTSYGGVMHYEVPKGFTLDQSGKSYYRIITVNGSGYEYTADNVVPLGSISGTKAVPAGNVFDKSSVRFFLYYDKNGNGSHDAGESLVSEGTTGSDGKISWKGDVTHLALGRYVVLEQWTPKKFICSDGTEGTYKAHNSSGWTKVSDTSYEKGFELTVAAPSFTFNATNEEESGSLSLTKTFLTDGDTGTAIFELVSNGKVLAKGIAKPSGKSGYKTQVIWEFNKEKKDTVRVPEGEYEIREYIPEVFYKDTKIKYSYATPSGWKRSSDGTYFYCKVSVTKDKTTKAEALNLMQKGSLTINKKDESEEVDGEFLFKIYWRGNSKSPENLGVFEDRFLLDTVKVATSKKAGGEGSYTLNDVPFGFYEIKEMIPEGYVLSWDDVEKNGILHITDEEGSKGKVSGTNKINIRVTVVKKDEWTSRVIAEPDKYSPEDHLIYTIYKDLNSNGSLDENEIKTGITSEDTDNDGKMVFDNVGKGDYLLKESGTLRGYYLSDRIICFSVKNNQDVILYPEDTPYGVPLKITKKDHDDKTLLSGAVFELYIDSNNNLEFDDEDKQAQVLTGTSLAPAEILETSKGIYECSGLIHFNDGSDLFGHNYILIEKSAPDGYFFVDEGGFSDKAKAILFSVAAEDCEARDFKVRPLEQTVLNKTGSVNVVKCNEEGTILGGAEFGVYKDLDCKEIIGEFKDKDGVYKFKGLSLGTYYLKELKAPSGYEADPGVYPFEITKDVPDVTVGNRLGIKYEQDGKFVNCTLRTTARDKKFAGEYGMMLSSGKDSVICDRVYYDGLVPGREYILEGIVLYSKDHKTSEGKVIKAGSPYLSLDGKPYVARKEFTAGKDGVFTLSEDKLTSEGYIEIDIPCDTSALAKDLIPVVICEKLYRKDTGELAGYHKDLKSVRQTLIPVEIGTELTSEDKVSHVIPVKDNVELIDKVFCRNLTLGKRYKIQGILMDQATGDPLLDGSGNKITSEKIFTLTKDMARDIKVFEYADEQANIRRESLGNVDIDITFSLDTTDLEGRVITAFEYLYVEDEGKFIRFAEHTDIEDKDQTVTCEKKIPKISTYLKDRASGTKTVSYGKNIVLTDTVSYEGLYPGIEYTLEGRIFNKTENRYLEFEGKEVTSELTFVPEEETGTVDMEFTIDSTALAGADLVAFETLSRQGQIVTSHQDKEDEGQTVTVPSCTTVALTKSGGKVISSQRQAVIIDSVEYKGLATGQKYTAVASLYLNNGERLIRSDGTDFYAKTEFTPESPDGKVDVKIEFSDNKLDVGSVIVVFEEIYLNDYKGGEGDILVACHKDLDCKEQSIGVELPATGEHIPSYMRIAAMVLMLISVSEALDIINKKRVERRPEHEKE